MIEEIVDVFLQKKISIRENAAELARLKRQLKDSEEEKSRIIERMKRERQKNDPSSPIHHSNSNWSKDRYRQQID